MPYRIVKWEQYQGWKLEHKTRPANAAPYPWFRVYRSLLQSADFFALPENIRWQWVLLLCISDDFGVIHDSDRSIAFKLRIPAFNPEPFLTPPSPDEKPMMTRYDAVNLSQNTDTNGSLAGLNPRTAGHNPPRGEERRRDRDQAKAVRKSDFGKPIGRESDPTPVSAELTAALTRRGKSEFVAAMAQIEPERAEWWPIAFDRAEQAGEAATNAAWSALESIQRRDCGLREPGRWMRSELKKAGARLPAWKGG